MEEEKFEELMRLAQPLVAWLNKYYNGHVQVVVQCDRVDLFEGVMGGGFYARRTIPPTDKGKIN